MPKVCQANSPFVGPDRRHSRAGSFLTIPAGFPGHIRRGKPKKRKVEILKSENRKSEKAENQFSNVFTSRLINNFQINCSLFASTTTVDLML
jgi:hypothetical protein